MAENETKRKLIYVLISTAIGILYGLFFRLVFALDAFKSFFEIMSVGFIFGVPFVIGFLACFVADPDRNWRLWKFLLFPWVPSTLALGGALLLAWEGIICIFLWLPLFLGLASCGGLCAWLFRLIPPSSRQDNFAITLLALAPLLVTPVEMRFSSPQDLRIIHTQIEIQADPTTIWNEIKEVRAIQEREHSPALVHAIGFPRPIEARLIGEGIGAVRHATFEGGVLFVETITRWQPNEDLAFSIKADPTPAATLDQHVTVGGPYFDVLNGDYHIEVLGPRRCILHLKSTHRLSTRFNSYAGLWTDMIMRDIQDYILNIICRRCEKGNAQDLELGRLSR